MHRAHSQVAGLLAGLRLMQARPLAGSNRHR